MWEILLVIDLKLMYKSGVPLEENLHQLPIRQILPSERFDLTYTDKDGSAKTPLCIHRAPLGTHERFIGFLIEHFGGNFPLWLAPKQITILPVSDKFNDYAQQITTDLRTMGLRVSLDNRSEKIGSKNQRCRNAKN